MLGLWVDIVRDKPPTMGGRSNTALLPNRVYYGVVWSPRVKAHVLHTVSLLISSARDASVLYYLLSQHFINQLITSMLPLKQWTDSALDIMVPAYVDLLKNLTLQLGSSPHLFTFLIVQKDDMVAFPLFSATLETGTSSFAQTDSFIHATCLNLMVGLMQINYTPIEEWIQQAVVKQQKLANHICDLLMHRYQRMASLTTGLIVNSVRSVALLNQVARLKDEIHVLNDLFSCHVRGFNVRLCETVLRRFIAVLLRDVTPSSGSSSSSRDDDDHLHHQPHHSRTFLCVGNSDNDVIPEPGAHAQTAIFILSQFFLHVEYNPLLRMLAVAILYPRSTEIWNKSTEHVVASSPSSSSFECLGAR